MKKLLIALAAFAACFVTAAEDARVEAAKQFFARFVELEQAYDPGLAELYAEEALITSRRTFPMGTPRDTVIPVGDYRQFLRQFLPGAKTNGERNTYSKVNYALEGERVRIKAARYSQVKGRTSPIILLVGASRDGKWLVYEELAESR